jgi:hypothetical protein
MLPLVFLSPISCSTVEASLDTKMDQVDPNNQLEYMYPCIRINPTVSAKNVRTKCILRAKNVYQCKTVQRRPGQDRITWETPNSRAFVPLQEPVVVLASYVPHTQMPV